MQNDFKTTVLARRRPPLQDMPLCAALVSLRALHPALSAANGFNFGEQTNGSNSGPGNGSNAGGGDGSRKAVDTLSGWLTLSPEPSTLNPNP